MRMMNGKRYLALLLGAWMLLALLAGCSNADKAGTGSVYWLNFKPEADAALQQIAKTYTAETGVAVKVVTAASGSYNETLTAEMDKSAAPTLFVVGSDAAVDTWGGDCYDLRDTAVYSQLTTDAFNLSDQTGKVCSIGYCYESYGLIVNQTLLKQAGYSLDDITNFDTLKAVADDIHARADQLGFDAFTSSGMDDSSSWRFTGHLANLPLYYESVDEGWTQAPAQLTGAYLDNFKAIWDLYITDCAYDPGTLATGGYDAQAEFLAGQAVFYQNGSWEYAALSQVYQDEELAMIPIYCGVPGEENAGLCSGTENCWAVNANASQADIQATLDFMYWMVTSEEGTAVMAEQFGAIPYQNAAESGNVFLRYAEEYLSQGRYNVDWVFQYTPNVEAWRAGLVSAMNQYDAGGSWDTVVTAFVSGWANQYAAANS